MFQPSFVELRLTGCRLDHLNNHRDLNIQLPAHGLDQQSLLSNPGVLENTEQGQISQLPLRHNMPDRRIPLAMAGGPLVPPPNMASNGGHPLLHVDRNSPAARVLAILLESNYDPAIIMDILHLLIWYSQGNV